MVHDPSMPSNKNLTPKERKGLDHIKDMLSSILSRRGIEKLQMSAFMEKETWFTAEDALNLKLVDEIIVTGKATQVNLVLAAVAKLNSDSFLNFIDNQVNTDMKIISALFGDNVLSEQQVTDQIILLQTENTALKDAAKEFKALGDQYKAEKLAAQKKEVENLIDGAIKNGFFAAEQRDTLIANGEKSHETFVATMASLKKPATMSLTGAINDGVIPAEEAKRDLNGTAETHPRS
jgi:ClpP class serine protease